MPIPNEKEVLEARKKGISLYFEAKEDPNISAMMRSKTHCEAYYQGEDILKAECKDAIHNEWKKDEKKFKKESE